MNLLLKDWFLMDLRHETLVPPEEFMQNFFGIIDDWGRFGKNKPISGSFGLGCENGRLIVARGPVWSVDLGNPVSSYEEQFPNARARLLEARGKEPTPTPGGVSALAEMIQRTKGRQYTPRRTKGSGLR